MNLINYKSFLIALIIVSISSCVITQKHLTTNLSSHDTMMHSTVTITIIEDFRDSMDRDHFPDAGIQFRQLIENELIRFNINLVTRSEMETLLAEQEIQLSDATEDIVEFGRIKNADFVIIGKLYDYSWSETAFSIQIISVSTGEIYFGASYSDNEPLWVPLFLSGYHPNNQMRKAISKIFDDLYERSQME